MPDWLGKTRLRSSHREPNLRSNEITFEDDMRFVPSSTDATTLYEVRLGRHGNVCECADHEHWGESCPHIYAATIARAKSMTCSCCGQCVPWRFVTEVQEERELLSWLVGDRLCADCVHGGTGREVRGEPVADVVAWFGRLTRNNRLLTLFNAVGS